MARQTEVHTKLIDDIDGTTAAETVSFALDGTNYEIDVTKKNAKALRSDLEKWTSHARKARGKGRAANRRNAPRLASQAPAIRAWATSNGIDVPARGRIPAAITEQYQAANN